MGDGTKDSTLEGQFPGDFAEASASSGGGGGTSEPVSASDRYMVLDQVGGFPNKQEPYPNSAYAVYFNGDPLGIDMKGLYSASAVWLNSIAYPTATSGETAQTSTLSFSAQFSVSETPAMGPWAYMFMSGFTTAPSYLQIDQSISNMTPGYFTTYLGGSNLGRFNLYGDNLTSGYGFMNLFPQLQPGLQAKFNLSNSYAANMGRFELYEPNMFSRTMNAFNHSFSGTFNITLSADANFITAANTLTLRFVDINTENFSPIGTQ